MKKSVRVLLTLALALLFSLPTYASGGGEKKVFTVAFMPGAADPFYYTMERGVRQKAKELGMNVVVGDYPDSWDPGKQIANLQALTAKGGIDFLLIAPASPAALVAPLKAIKDKGTAIVTVATFLGDGDYTRTSSYSFPLAHIGTDDRLGGRLVAERLAKLIGGKGKVYVMNTSPDVSSDTDRGDGFRDGIAEFPKIRLVGMDYCGGSQERAAELTTAALMKDPDIVGIFAAGEPGALGAAQSVRSAGLSGAVKVGSWDATQALVDAVKGKDIDFVLAQLPAEMGSLGIDAGYRYLAMKTMPPKKIVPGFQFITQDDVSSADMQQYVYSK